MKKENVIAYLMEYPLFANYPHFFNVNSAENDTVSIIPSNSIYSPYWSGTRKVQEDYILNVFMDGSSYQILDIDLNENIIDLFKVQEFVNWIEDNNKYRKFPKTDENETVLAIEPIHETPQTEIDQNNIYKYWFGIRITYIKKQIRRLK